MYAEKLKDDEPKPVEKMPQAEQKVQPVEEVKKHPSMSEEEAKEKRKELERKATGKGKNIDIEA